MFRFPETVDENAARLVAGGVVILTATFLLTGWLPLLVVLFYGFVARVVSGPTFSPLALIATRVILPRTSWEARPTAGAPKRFAQAIGATLSGVAVVLGLTVSAGAAAIPVAMILAAASLESFAGYCLGCTIFGWLMRRGVIPEAICVECADLSRRFATSAASPVPNR